MQRSNVRGRGEIGKHMAFKLPRFGLWVRIPPPVFYKIKRKRKGKGKL